MLKLFEQALDMARMSEMNRLLTRMARRCSRDLKHAVDAIPEGREHDKLKARSEMWSRVFWNSSDYRDDLHRQIERLEEEKLQLEMQLEELNETPRTKLPF